MSILNSNVDYIYKKNLEWVGFFNSLIPWCGAFSGMDKLIP